MFRYKAKIVLNGDVQGWYELELESLPRSCGCDASLEQFLVWAAEERFANHPTDQVEILAFRTLNEKSKIGTRTLYLVHRHSQYGGPEEGGWWYSDEEVVREFEIPSKNFHRHLMRLQAYCNHYNKDIRSWETSQKLHVTAYKQHRTHRPHYC